MYQKLLKDIPGQVYTPPQLGTYYYAFNTQKGPTADSRVRLALSMTIDRRLMAEKVLGTGEKPAWHLHRMSRQDLSPILHRLNK